MCHFCITRWTAVTSRMSRQGLKCARSTASRLRATTRACIARWALVTCQAHNEKSKLSLFTMKTKFEKKKKTENDSAAMTHPLNFFTNYAWNKHISCIFPGSVSMETKQWKGQWLLSVLPLYNNPVGGKESRKRAQQQVLCLDRHELVAIYRFCPISCSN